MSLTHRTGVRLFQERVAATPGPDGDESGCRVVANVPRALAPPTVSQTVPDSPVPRVALCCNSKGAADLCDGLHFLSADPNLQVGSGYGGPVNILQGMAVKEQGSWSDHYVSSYYPH